MWLFDTFSFALFDSEKCTMWILSDTTIIIIMHNARRPEEKRSAIAILH